MALRLSVFLLSLGCTCFGLFAFAAQAEVPGKGIEVVAVGEITNIDSAGRWLTLKGLLPEENPVEKPRQSITVGGLSVSVGGSVKRGRVTVGGGVGEPKGPDASPFPRPQPAPTSPGPAPDESKPAYINMRIWITEATRIVGANGEVIPLSALHKGDQATVRGIPRDDSIDAAEITVTDRKGGQRGI